MNTYALRANLKDVDPEEFLKPRRLEEMQGELQEALLDFNFKTQNIYELIVDHNEQNQPRLGAKFAIFKMKFPEDIKELENKYNSIIDEISAAIK